MSGDADNPRHLLHVFPSFGVGGIQVRFARVVNKLGHKYRHSVLALDGNTACMDRVRPGLATMVVPPSYHGLASLHGMAALIRQQRPDRLLTYNWGATEWALANRLFARVSHVHFEDGFGAEEANGQFLRRVLFRRLALGGVAKVVVPSMALHDIARRSWRLPAKSIAYIPNGIDIEGFQPPGARAGSAPLVIGTIAPLRREKNIGRLIQAFGRLAPDINACLVIAGGGAEREHLEALAAELVPPGRVRFLGPIASPAELLPTFDVFAISSDTEQMPLNVLEAMAAGLPVAGVDVGDVKFMLSEANSEMITPRDDTAGLARTLGLLLQNPQLRQHIGQANRTAARDRFPESTMVNAYDDLFRN